MNAASRVLNFLVSPLLPVIGALFSSEVEKLVALAEIDQQDEIEERARNLEAEGKTHLASRLRQRASQISTDRPGHYGTQIIGQAPTRTVTICWSTRRAAQWQGGLAPFRQHAGQLEHDLGTASVLTALYETDPPSAEQWVGEDILRRDFTGRERCLKKIPDGAIVADDRVTKVIEFGGQYSSGRLRRFHQHFARYRVPYDIY
ncbi:MAG: hypothetical protein HQ567_00725 [Candidatus Nealsonbacteria bacterium]|nr:hypothetical protein [Candidatus Nealsonbacteria bacterium]